MEYGNKEIIDAGINWILNFQSVERDKECEWPGKDLYTRWGGCMKKVPCYYGVIKSMIALTEYRKKFAATKRLETTLNQ